MTRTPEGRPYRWELGRWLITTGLSLGGERNVDPQRRRVAGKIVGVDVSKGTVTLERPDGRERVVDAADLYQ